MSLLRKFNLLFDQKHVYSNYSVSRKEHYENILNPKDIVDLLEKYAKLPKKRLYTEVPITFRGAEFGTTLKEFTSSNEKPRYVIQNNHHQNIDHTVLFYKERLGKHKAISQFHFIDQSFLVGMYLFKNFLLKQELKDVVDVMLKKYNISESPLSEEFIISDGSSNIIQMKNDVYTSVFYLSGDNVLLDDLRRRINGYQGMRRLPNRNEDKSLFDQL